MTIPPVVTDGAGIVTAVGVTVIWLRQGDIRKELDRIWARINGKKKD